MNIKIKSYLYYSSIISIYKCCKYTLWLYEMIVSMED